MVKELHLWIFASGLIIIPLDLCYQLADNLPFYLNFLRQGLNTEDIAHHFEGFSRVEGSYSQFELSVLQMAQVKKVIDVALRQSELWSGEFDVMDSLLLAICLYAKLLYEVHDTLHEE